VHALRVEDPLPRAYAVGGTRVADGLPALRLLLSPDFDPRREVLLPEGTPSPAPSTFSSEVRITEARPDRIRIAATLNAPGHVLVLDAWDAGWRARVDGRDAPVLRGNVGFRAVPAPTGSHQIELVYRPRGLGLALASSAVAATLVLGAVLRLGTPSATSEPPNPPAA
jgi:hypothetical protein